MSALKAGVGRAAITPPIGAEMIGWGLRKGLSIGIHDALECRALVLDDGRTPAAIVSLEMIGIPHEMTEQIRGLVAGKTPIPRGNILLNCSHTHASPSTLPGYHTDKLTPAHSEHLRALPYHIAGAIIEAWHRRREARIGAASTMVHGITVNRRDPKLPVDPQLGVIRVDDAAGRPLACLVNYACHGTAVGPHDLEWTADFAGYVADAIESAVPGCAGLFLQGAEGDIHPWDNYFGNTRPRFPDGYESAERLGKAIAGPAVGLLQQITTEPDAVIGVAGNTITLPPRPINWTAEEAEAYLAQVEATTAPWTGEVVPPECPACMSAQTYPALYLLSGARHEARFARHYPAGIPAELTVVRINDIVFAGNPGELFSELGMQIKARSPYRHTFVLSITNNWMGYIPTREAAEAVLGFSLAEFLDPVKHRRHYGATTTTEVGPAAGEMVVAETLRLIGLT
jgi:neutral ceramidase